MKNLKDVRKVVSFILCLAITVSAFSVLAFAGETDAEEAKEALVQAYVCPHCGGTVKLFPGGTTNSTYTHPYVTYNSKGEAEEHLCTVTETLHEDAYLCVACGALLMLAPYTTVVHSGCGA